MPIEIIRNDITKLRVDAIVNAANESLLRGGGVDGAIHRAAGPGLLAECRTLGGCRTGDAKITGGYNLPSRHVIHTVGPIWQGGGHGEREKLVSCYRRCLEIARAHRLGSIAFPLISAGAYGYPKAEALRVAMDTIRDFLLENDMLVYLVIFDKASFSISGKLYAGIVQYIDDHYVDAAASNAALRRRSALQFTQDGRVLYPLEGECGAPPEASCRESIPKPAPLRSDASPIAFPSASPSGEFSLSLEQLLRQVDESFSQMVLRKIDEKGISDVSCYKRANLDRKLFSKIRSDIHYKPSKRTALALAIALELSLEETRDLLMKAGFALSRSSKFDIIIEYFILNRRYDIHEINESLFMFDQALLGG